METKLQELQTRLREVDDLQQAGALLNWDQLTGMPSGGGPARARQLATPARLPHERFTDPAVGQLLDDLRQTEESLPPESHDASLIHVARHDYEKAARVPAAFVEQVENHVAATYELWTRARPDNDFAAVRPALEKTLELSREMANYFPGYAHIADPLIDRSDNGMTAESVRALFADLRQQLVPLVQAITARPMIDDSCLYQHFPEAQQLAFALNIAQRFGYDMSRGRLDKSPHPFMTKFSIGDVRITTRTSENDLGSALFSIFHESGHAMYEQGIDTALEGTLLANGTSAGVHESQSRLWENIVGRSKTFWEYAYPQLQKTFPDQLNAVSLDTFYGAINKVQPSLIRTDADEVTYNLHVMLRFDFELDLLEGKLAVRDLPEAWRERFKADFGIVPPDDRDGVLQDVHWYGGLIGGSFQGYTIGNVMSAQFFDAAVSAHPQIRTQIAQGECSTLLGWLKDNVYQYGRIFTAPELIQRATGSSLRIEPYMAYLREKYSQLYQL